MAIVLPAVQDASASGGGGRQAGVRHAPRTPSGGARIAAVSGVSVMPALPLRPMADVSASAAAVLTAPPLAAPFVPPRG